MYNERLKDFLDFSVGFDSVFRSLEGFTVHGTPYPHFDVIKDKDSDNYIMEMALAGYKKDSLKVNVEDNVLIVEGGSKDEDSTSYVKKGIAKRYFKKKLQLADHLEVTSSKFEDGMLSVVLKNIRKNNKKEIKIS
tara:strand:+ start:732 stop:1136 length:405 start_codon:yes stop_codon:yes gene_type:complete